MASYEHWKTEGYSGISDQQHDSEHESDDIRHAHAQLWDDDLCLCEHERWEHDPECRHDGAFRNTRCSCPSFDLAEGQPGLRQHG